MDKTRSRIILYTLTSIAALTVPLLFSDSARTHPLLLPSLAPALIAIALLARTCLAQLDAAHSLSAQLGEMIERRDIRHLFVPVSGAPEMNAVGHRLNVLIYTMAESTSKVLAANSRPREHHRSEATRAIHRIAPEVLADAA
ncbi:MAG TPA: hypothetical protein DFK12_07230 [Gallionellaceae bacterium]|nr:hypothetical protein [Gallionellaceae bacterium]